MLLHLAPSPAPLAAGCGLFRLACACVGVKHSAEALEPVGYTHALAILQTHRKFLGEPQTLPQGTKGMRLEGGAFHEGLTVKKHMRAESIRRVTT